MIIFTPNSATFTSFIRNLSAVIVTATLDYFNGPDASVYLSFSHKGLLQLERRKYLTDMEQKVLKDSDQSTVICWYSGWKHLC